MKIGIVTFHRAVNYGSILQAYALSRFLEDSAGNGCVEIIDYQNRAQKNIYRLFEYPRNIKAILRNFHSLVNILPLKRKYEKFYSFVKENLCLTSDSYSESDRESLSENSKKYTHLISGSDQIWNVKCADFDENYFLAFNNCSKKIAYAPSLGRMDFTKDEEEYFKCYLKNYDAVSVRESSAVEYLERFCNFRIENVLDPVFLLSANQWDEIAVKPLASEKYILCYFLGNIGGMRDFAKRLSKETGLKIVVLIKSLRDVLSGFETRFDAGPKDFLGLVSNAEYVVTDSFHAVCFSIIYHRRFWAFSPLPDARELGSWMRIPCLLNIVGLEDRILNADNVYSKNPFSDIDFEKADESFAGRIEASKNFLKDALGLSK